MKTMKIHPPALLLVPSLILSYGQELFPFRQILHVTSDSLVSQTLDTLTTVSSLIECAGSCLAGDNCNAFHHQPGPLCTLLSADGLVGDATNTGKDVYLLAPLQRGDGLMSQWSAWDDCTVTCGTGTRRSFRNCSEPTSGGLPCEGPTNKTEPCNTDPCPTCSLPATDVAGPTLASLSASTAGDCLQLCAADAACRSWIHWDVHCVLKESYFGCDKFDRSGHESGPRSCPEVMPPVDTTAPCFLPDTDINGTELARVTVADPSGCQQSCFDNPHCTVWIFWNPDQCTLKDTIEGCWRFDRIGYTAGPREC